ncbi:hypothetical protein FHS31_001877 [Sphingomonas vulcanisoli]|uniref:Uncharacterized protein n=1 Tax=Sphingomonas vulcanisoli TaxID=1658060 RepID=A0ABX0TWU9_9SPHN|nr:hypothetical protein [Sphingomonas vulcanisoli]
MDQRAILRNVEQVSAAFPTRADKDEWLKNLLAAGSSRRVIQGQRSS